MVPANIVRRYVAKCFSCVKLTVLVVALVFGLAPDAFSKKAVWCGKLAGLLERNYAQEESASSIELAKSIAGEQGKTFLYVRRTSIKAQARAAAGGAIPLIMSTDSKSKQLPTPTADQVEEQMKDPAVQPSLDEFLAAFKDTKPEPNWYFYSNSPLFSEYFEKQESMELEDSGKGAVLLMDESGEKAALNPTIENVATYIHAGIIFVEGETPFDITVPGSKDSRPLVLNLRDMGGADHDRVSNGLSATSRLQKATPENTMILFMMPETRAEATEWGFPEEKADQYVTNGQRIKKDLARYGFNESITMEKNRESSLAAMSSASTAGKSVIVVIGESGPGGNVRIPGSSELLSPQDLSTSMGSATLLGLVCNSQTLLTETSGLGVVGTVYTDQLRRIARVLLDKRPPDSSTEYLDVPYSTDPQITNPSMDAVAAIAGDMVVESAHGPELPILFTATPPVYATSTSGSGGSPGTAGGGGNTPGEHGSPLLLALAGVVGALAREILRWRRLSSRKRADIFRKPKYIAISAVQVVLGGAVAMIFGQAVSGSWVYVIGFVCGAGLEEIVRRAMMLKVWTPSVPHGPETVSEDSSLEYLRA